jgi:hypothetical protein
MPEPAVRVYDLETKALTTIPARELAEGMVRIPAEGVEGEVFVSAAQLTALQPGLPPYRRPPFGEGLRAVVAALRDALREVRPLSLEQWEDGLRRDIDPDKELTLWLGMAEVYRRLTEGHGLGPDEKRDVFAVILACLNNGPDRALFTVNLRALSRKAAEGIVEHIRSQGK